MVELHYRLFYFDNIGPNWPPSDPRTLTLTSTQPNIALKPYQIYVFLLHLIINHDLAFWPGSLVWTTILV